MDSIVFTPASIIDLLSKIDELADYDISITETIDGGFQLTVGDSAYLIPDDAATDVSVPEEAVKTIEDANLEAYENLDDSIDVNMGADTPVESGILKEVAKTLLVGGIVRLGAKLLK